jgi:hypothetical protein
MLASCDTDDKDAAFLVINEVDVAPLRAGVQETQNISDVWVILDNENYGVWPLPARIPIELSGKEQVIQLAPGVRVNGVSGAARQYPYFDFYTIEREFTSGEEVEVVPRFEYFDIVEVGFDEGFEISNNFAIDLDGNVNTTILRDDGDARLGTHSGRIAVTSEDSEMQVSNLTRLNANLLDGPNAYLELDYKGDIPLLVGYITYGNFIDGDFKVLVTESEEWKKLYIDLSQELTAGGVEEYQIQLGTSLDGLAATSGTIYVDNVRLLHF